MKPRLVAYYTSVVCSCSLKYIFLVKIIHNAKHSLLLYVCCQTGRIHNGNLAFYCCLNKSFTKIGV